MKIKYDKIHFYVLRNQRKVFKKSRVRINTAVIKYETLDICVDILYCVCLKKGFNNFFFNMLYETYQYYDYDL